MNKLTCMWSPVENTKEYICRAVVTVVDHLGCVSNNLDYLLFKNNSSSETELRIDCLKQVKSSFFLLMNVF